MTFRVQPLKGVSISGFRRLTRIHAPGDASSQEHVIPLKVKMISELFSRVSEVWDHEDNMEDSFRTGVSYGSGRTIETRL